MNRRKVFWNVMFFLICLMVFSIVAGEELTSQAEINLFASRVHEIEKKETGEGKISIKETPGRIEIENQYYQVVMGESDGYALSMIKDKKSGLLFSTTPGLVFQKRQRFDPTGQDLLAPEYIHQKDNNAQVRVTAKETDYIQCMVTWKNNDVEVSEVLTFYSYSRCIGKDYRIKLLSPMDKVMVEMNLTEFGERAIFYPEEERISFDKYKEGPGYMIAYDPEKKAGIGFMATDGKERLNYYMRGRPEGEEGNRIYLACYGQRLSHKEPGEELQFRTCVVVGGKGEELARALEDYCRLDLKKPVIVEEVWPEKLIYRKEEKAKVHIVLKNNSAESKNVKLICEITGGIDEREKIFEKEIELAVRERKKIEVEWDTTGKEYGFEIMAKIMEAGKEIDSGKEYFAVTDKPIKVTQMNVVNPGVSKEGQEKWLIPNLRRSYTGIMEYYNWAPSHRWELTPDTETFEPHTESQGTYRVAITRKFIKDMIALAHQNGLYVMAELSPFSSLPTAMQHPEEMYYTEDGQFYIFNRKIYNGNEEFATVYTNFFSPERVERWTDEMAASVKMFGWDGVRFDLTFLPIPSSADPLYVLEMKEYDLYDFLGRPATERFPDPDTVAAELTNVWRNRMEEKCPGFQYLTNHCQSGTPERLAGLRLYPKWNVAMARDSGGLLEESLLNTCSEDWNTWEKYAKALRDGGVVVRQNGGQPLVGWMRDGPSVYLQTMHYLVFASGYHFFGYAGPRNSLDETWKHYRFATRYSEYLYDPGLKYLPVEQKIVSVSDAERVLWKYLVYERERGERKELIINLINLPEEDVMVRYHEPPSVKKGIEVTVEIPEGKNLKEAWLLVPEPEPSAVKLATRVGNGRVIITLPELISCGILIAEF